VEKVEKVEKAAEREDVGDGKRKTEARTGNMRGVQRARKKYIKWQSQAGHSDGRKKRKAFKSRGEVKKSCDN
jgi:hypothetical protein